MLKKFRLTSSILLCLSVLLSNCRPNPYREGERLYKTNCANCHMEDGKGLHALIPPLAGSDYLKNHREKLPCLVKYGIRDTIVVNGKVFAEQMPGVATLSEIQIVNILNFVGNEWGNENKPFRLEETRTLLEKCQR